ncbi:conserved hypothetical protein [Frankia canadensis]|uniref:Uncharacterized protein n=1 Tax=Frankia canadensis TaxID=1836972 RepID=A0A2I2KI72_9ACTN|nr:hypothetical protein [Frankia canadensis]SNQ45367.1 conserved hypothetical protein [Frankia canadensis]SOU52657.1 conserved hypothetical protein [Frankia canadensis]
MTDIARLAASIDDFPTIEETDAMLDELRRLPRDEKMCSLIDDLLECRSLLLATG